MLISDTYQQNLTTELANAFAAYFKSISQIAKKTAVSPATTAAPTEATTVATVLPAGLIALVRRRKRASKTSARVA